MGVLASHGVGGFFALWPRVYVAYAVVALPLVAIIDLVRRRRRRIPRHLAAAAVAGVFVAVSALPNVVWTDHEDALPRGQRHGACLGCGLILTCGGALGVGAAVVVNRLLDSESERRSPPPQAR